MRNRLRILWYEWRKFLDIRVIFALLIFTALFHSAYLAIDLYPNGEPAGSGKRLREELMERVGPELDASELGELFAYEAEADARWRELIADRPQVAGLGFEDYYAFREMRESAFQRSAAENAGQAEGEMGLTEEEVRVYELSNDLYFRDPETSSVLFLRQCIDEIKGMFGLGGWIRENYLQTRNLTREEAEERFSYSDWSWGSERYWARRRELAMRDEISLLPYALLDTVREDLVRIAVLILVCCGVLIVPVQVRERVRAVRPLIASSRSGRRVFTVQGGVCLLTGFLVWAVQYGIYLIRLGRCGGFTFLDCSLDNGFDLFWADIRFRTFLVLSALLSLAFTLGVCALLLLISRAVSNYVAGFAAALLLLGVGGIYYVFRMAGFLMMAPSGKRFREFPGILLPAAAAAVLLFGLLRWERKRDLR